jgi:hypothetical protein
MGKEATGFGMFFAGLIALGFGQVGLGLALIAGGMGGLMAPEIDELEDYGNQIRLNTRSTEQALPIVYGQVKVGGNHVFIEPSGAHNVNLWIVQTLSEGECDSIAQDGGADLVYLNDKLESEFGGYVSYWFHGGSDTQAVDANLNGAIGKWTDCLKNTCYIIFKLVFHQDLFQNIPRCSVVLKGRKLFDYRDSSTAYSNNPALVLYDYMRNSRYGLGFAAAKFDVTSWTAAANFCDTESWTFNGVVYGTQSASNVINQILSHFRGTLVWYDGKFYLHVADLPTESSVMTIQDKHILQDASGRAMVSIKQPSRLRRPDGARITYVDPDKNYVTDHITVGSETGVVRDIKLLGCTSRQQASDLGIYNLERAQLDRSLSGVFRDDCLKLEPHDIVTFNSDALSISNQTMRVAESNIQPDGTVGLSLLYEDTDLYNDDYDLDAEGTYECDLPDPNDEPPPVANVSLSEETYYYRLRTFTRLKCTFDLPAGYIWLQYVEVWLSFDNSTWEHLFNASDDFEIDPVEEGATYWLRLKTVSIWDTKQDDANDYKVSKTIIGETSAPGSLTSLQAIANQNSVLLYADKVSDPDVELYEFRLGDSWSGAIFLSALRSPNLSLTGVKPGAFTFWCNTLSNNGTYGATPRSASVTLKDPPDGWAVQDTQSDDYL